MTGPALAEQGLDNVLTLRDFEPLAAARIEALAWAYLSSGAGDERSLSWNEQAWADIALVPRILQDVAQVSTEVQLMGSQLAHPILLAPAAAQAAFHAEGELGTLRGAAASGALYVQSTHGSIDVETVGRQARAPWWFQLYVQRDREFVARLVDRAQAAGTTALVLTVDSPTGGRRDRDQRLYLRGQRPKNLPGHDKANYPNLIGLRRAPDGAPAHRRVYDAVLDPSLTWSDVEWLVARTSVPVLLKGLLRADDVQRAIDSGAAGVIVSNHGARQVDTVVPTAAALPAIAKAAAGRLPVLVDGGIRRGTDVLKALCLGADGVLLGRPYLWALGAFGGAGVARAVDILRTELEIAMCQVGARSLAELTPDLLDVDGSVGT